MVSYLFGSLILAVLGLAAVIAVAAAARSGARQRRELARRESELSSRQELEDFIGRVDQALSEEDIDRLGNKEKGDH